MYSEQLCTVMPLAMKLWVLGSVRSKTWRLPIGLREAKGSQFPEDSHREVVEFGRARADEGVELVELCAGEEADEFLKRTEAARIDTQAVASGDCVAAREREPDVVGDIRRSGKPP